jgi:hypothetical protein
MKYSGFTSVSVSLVYGKLYLPLLLLIRLDHCARTGLAPARSLRPLAHVHFLGWTESPWKYGNMTYMDAISFFEVDRS